MAPRERRKKSGGERRGGVGVRKVGNWLPSKLCPVPKPTLLAAGLDRHRELLRGKSSLEKEKEGGGDRWRGATV